MVYMLLSRINERKAPGLDNIPNKLIKIAAEIISPSLTEIFARSISTGIFPSEWKTARVSPIFKKGKKNDPNNYRPISVIPAVAKIFEKVIFEQLYNYFNINRLLTHCQSGFRSLHSTLTALLEATSNWSVNIDSGLLNGVIFIDLKKAFDTIDHDILLRRLYDVDQSSLKWFQSYQPNHTCWAISSSEAPNKDNVMEQLGRRLCVVSPSWRDKVVRCCWILFATRGLFRGLRVMHQWWFEDRKR